MCQENIRKKMGHERDLMSARLGDLPYSQLLHAAHEMKHLLDIQPAGQLFHPGGGDARDSYSYQAAAELLSGLGVSQVEQPQAVSASTDLWLVKFEGGVTSLRRLDRDEKALGLTGRVRESYRPMASDEAAVALVAISQGFEPPRGLLRLDKQAG